MGDVNDLTARSSIGEGLSWAAFGKLLREKRLRFRLKVSEVGRLSGLPEGRIIEIEHGCPPFAAAAEVDSIASALGLDPSALRARSPR